MKRTKIRAVSVVVALCAATLLSGCVANVFPGGPSVAGSLYTDVIDPSQHLAVAMDPRVTGTKKGVASASAVLGLVATGDASVDAAMRAGGITRVHHVDHEVTLILFGVWSKVTTIVYGE